MTGQNDVRRLLQRLAAHPVLPPTDQLPPNDEALHALLVELAAGERSRYADTLRGVADECGIAPQELAHRAEFLLACLILPRAGTYYEVLGVAPTASADEIRRGWAALIQRYHPDHLGGSGGWVDDQARQLIEAYQTLKDPERRRRYDADLEHQRSAIAAPSLMRRTLRPSQPQRWRWVPLVLMLLGSTVVLALYAWRTPPPLPQVALPPAPKLLEGRQQAAYTDALASARSPKPNAAVPEAAPSPTPVPAPEEGQASTPVPTSLPVDPPAVTTPPGQKPAEMPRSTLRPHNSSAPSGKLPETTPVRGSAPQQVEDGEAGSTPGMPEPPAVRPEPDTPRIRPRRGATPARPDALDRTARPGPVEGRIAAQDTPSDSPQGSLVKGQTPLAQQPSERTRELQPPLRAQPIVARIKPNDSGAEDRLLADDPLALIESFRAAYEGKDLGMMMRLFAAVPRERDVVGRSGVQELYARNFAALDRIQYEIGQLAMTAPAANGALIVQGRFRIRAIRRDNPSDLVNVAGTIRWVLRPEAEADALRIAEIHYELSRP
jgi:DnaJ domain